MCLDKLIPIDKKDPDKVRYGYKVFAKNYQGFLSSDIMGNSNTPYIYKNKWIHESKYRPSDVKGRKKINAEEISGIKYPFGFHIFLSKKAAEKYKCKGGYPYKVIRRVKYRKLVASGYQLDTIGWKAKLYGVDVAKEMYVMEE